MRMCWKIAELYLGACPLFHLHQLIQQKVLGFCTNQVTLLLNVLVALAFPVWGLGWIIVFLLLGLQSG